MRYIHKTFTSDKYVEFISQIYTYDISVRYIYKTFTSDIYTRRLHSRHDNLSCRSCRMHIWISSQQCICLLYRLFCRALSQKRPICYKCILMGGHVGCTSLFYTGYIQLYSLRYIHIRRINETYTNDIYIRNMYKICTSDMYIRQVHKRQIHSRDDNWHAGHEGYTRVFSTRHIHKTYT